MDDQVFIPRSADDQEGALRSFKDFSFVYTDTLQQVSQYLDSVLANIAPEIAQGYQPWRKALQDLVQGTVAMAHKLKPKNPEAFFEALQIFSLDSAVQFIRDLCLSCKIKLEREWDQRFQQHIDTLLFAYSILTRRQHEESLAR